MRVLVLTSFNRTPDFEEVYKGLSELINVDKLVLDKAAQKNLRSSLKEILWNKYDRIFLDLHFKNIYKQTNFLRNIVGLFIYEEDSCQNYITQSRWFGKFSTFYRALPNAKIIVTGSNVSHRLRQEGFSASFIPKGYNSRNLFDERKKRDIELGFIGRTASNAYSGRKEILDNISEQEPLQILRTAPGIPYRQMLNRIRYFVSADVGLEEYMAKNFEAMACGCVLLAWRQGIEEEAIGLKNKQHILLYSSVNELRECLDELRKNPQFAMNIATSGKKFVEENLSHRCLAKHLARELQTTWPFPPVESCWKRLFSLLRRRNI